MSWVGKLFVVGSIGVAVILMSSLMPGGMYLRAMTWFLRSASSSRGFSTLDAIAILIFGLAVCFGITSAVRVQSFRMPASGSTGDDTIRSVAIQGHTFLLCVAICLAMWLGPLILLRFSKGFDSEKSARLADNLEQSMRP